MPATVRTTRRVNRLFAPEFRNRLDAIIPFTHLEPETVGHVVDKFISKLESQLADRNVAINLEDTARKWLAHVAMTAPIGARPLARLIAEKIKKPLADEVLFGKLAKGGTVVIGVKEDELTFTYSKASAAQTAAKRAAAMEDEDEDEVVG